MEKTDLFKNIIAAIGTTYNLDDVLNIICREVRKFFHADRVAIACYPKTQKHCGWQKLNECLVSSNITSLHNFHFSVKFQIYLEEYVLEKGQEMIIDNIKESDQPDFFREEHEKLGTKSIINIPIERTDDKWGVLGIFQNSYYRHWTEEEIELLHTIIDYIYVAIRQAELRNALEQTNANQKAILNNMPFLAWLKDSESRFIAVNEQVAKICNTTIENMIGKTDFDFFSKEYAESYVREDREVMKARRTIPTKDLIAGPEGIRWHETFKSPIFDAKGNVIGTVGLSRDITEENKAELELLRWQELLIDANNREKLLREIIENLRSSLDIDKVKNQLLISIGQAINANRCFIVDYDQNNHKFLPIKNEYLSSPDEKSILGVAINVDFPHFAEMTIDKKDNIIKDTEKFYKEAGPEFEPEKQQLKKYNVKSDYGIAITYANQFIGILVSHFTEKKCDLGNEDLEFLRILAHQVGIAIYQAQLYEKEKQAVEKEKILREIITELKLFKNVGDAFNYLLSKIANIYNASRTLLIEVPVQENEKPKIGYEYIKNKSVPSFKNVSFPEACQKMFKDIFETFSPVALSDTKYVHPDDTEVQNFFKIYSIDAFMGCPLIRYNHETKFMGILFICSDEPRDWSEFEVNLLKAINESVVNVIWEILKTIEVNRLRDTFVITLAHDLQVPIIGDIKALEFLASRPRTEAIGGFKELIDETIINDKRILTILKNLLESYQYESGKKELKLAKTNLSAIINNAIDDDNKKLADSKKISIETHIPDNLPEIKVDQDEIFKIISTILDNAINYTQAGGHIIIDVKYKSNSMTTCISDNGPGIPEHIRDLIFKRYEMAIEIERKIGAGISLYLAKQIVEAHKGKIWYTTELGKGSKFCFSLPAISYTAPRK